MTPDGWIPEKMRGRLSDALSDAGAGAEATSVVMGRECRARSSPVGCSTRLPCHARRWLQRVRYHSADVAARPAHVMSRPALRVAVLGAGTVGREVVRALLEGGADLPSQAGALQLTAIA